MEVVLRAYLVAVIISLSNAGSPFADLTFADCSALTIISRDEWQAREEIRHNRLPLPLNKVIISHTVTKSCSSKPQCARLVRLIQDMHMDERGWDDIGFSFLVGGDGNIYEGRGWFHTGSFAMNFNNKAYGVSFIGNFEKDQPTERMLNATWKFFNCAVRKGYLKPTWEIHGHKDVSCTQSPGINLYRKIRSYRNYKGGRLPGYICKRLPMPSVNAEHFDLDED